MTRRKTTGPAKPFFKSTAIHLTPREEEVISLLWLEMLDKEIAAELGLSPRTIHEHVRTMLRKCGKRNRTGLALFWERYERRRIAALYAVPAKVPPATLPQGGGK